MRNKKWLLVAWSIYILTFILQITLLSQLGDGEPDETKFVWTNVLGSFVAGCLLILFYIIPIHRFLEDYRTWHKIILLFFAGFIFCLLFMAITTFLQGLMLGESTFIWYKDNYLIYLKYHFHNIFKNYIFLTVLLFALDYFQRENKLIKREGKLKNRLVQMQLENLKSQFQPHFLFNALNSIVAVIDENKDKAQIMLVQLSDILRISINNDYNCEHSLEDEIRFLEKYLGIEKIRFEEQLNYSIEIDPDTRKMKIPCLILQPMVENAIKHGFKRNRKPLSLRISASKDDKTVRISNNGSKLGDYIYGHGISGIQDRLKVLYGDAAGFSMYQQGEWVINEIKLV